MIIDLQLDKRIFNEVYLQFLTWMTAVQILFGGSSSGKSVAAAQRCVIDVASGGRNYLCIRNVKATIKNSMFNEICKAITRFKLTPYFSINHSDLVITCANGYQILFAGLDDVMKVKSITPVLGVITDILIEEATEIEQNDFRQLQRRLRGLSRLPKRITMLFNPIWLDHWIHTVYFKNWDDSKTYYNDGRVSILKTTYKDNLRFLEQGDIDILEDETDKYYHDVYTLGNWGVLGNVIFKNWEVRDLTEERKIFDKYRNGLDFGFSSDPAALVRSHYDKNHKTIYITDEIYMKEMTNDILGKDVKQLIGNEYVTCDSAEPKSIADLRNMDINALSARKGKDSVNFGIDWLQRQKIVIDVRCQNAKNEFQQYKWKEDKDGMVLKVPVDKNNHILDGLRYSYEDEMEDRQLKALKPFM
jgi:phage terminase large subunit